MKFIQMRPAYCTKHGQLTMHKMSASDTEYLLECDCGHFVKWAFDSVKSLDEFLLDYKDQNTVGSTPKTLSEKVQDTKIRVAAKTKRWWEKTFDALNN